MLTLLMLEDGDSLFRQRHPVHLLGLDALCRHSLQKRQKALPIGRAFFVVD